MDHPSGNLVSGDRRHSAWRLPDEVCFPGRGCCPPILRNRRYVGDSCPDRRRSRADSDSGRRDRDTPCPTAALPCTTGEAADHHQYNDDDRYRAHALPWCPFRLPVEYKHINHFEYLSGNHSTRGRLDPRILQREYDEPVPYRPQHEAKADWLAGMLLPPRVALLAIVQRAMPSQAPTRGYA
jgi:hypothetical protein